MTINLLSKEASIFCKFATKNNNIGNSSSHDRISVWVNTAQYQSSPYYYKPNSYLWKAKCIYSWEDWWQEKFWAFLRFGAAADPNMQQHLKSCSRHAKYTSHRIQNELINLFCGNQIRNKIIASINSAGIFTILAGETEGISCTK